MEDVLLDGVPDQRRGLRTVPVLRPVNDAGYEVHEKVDADGLGEGRPPRPNRNQHGRVHQHNVEFNVQGINAVPNRRITVPLDPSFDTLTGMEAKTL